MFVAMNKVFKISAKLTRRIVNQMGVKFHLIADRKCHPAVGDLIATVDRIGILLRKCHLNSS